MIPSRNHERVMRMTLDTKKPLVMQVHTHDPDVNGRRQVTIFKLHYGKLVAESYFLNPNRSRKVAHIPIQMWAGDEDSLTAITAMLREAGA